MPADDTQHDTPDPRSMHRRFARHIAVAIVLLAATALFLYFRANSEQPAPPVDESMRMPVGKPLLEPDRPDLIDDPGIAREEDETVPE